MSEHEIKRRQEYKRNRKKWTVVQLVAVSFLLIAALVCSLIYNRMDRNQYVQYTESSAVDYRVQYRENEFFDKEWIEKDKSYISSLISDVSADFSYAMDVDADNMSFECEYWIDATLVVSRDNNGSAYYTVEERILPMKSVFLKEASAVNINETISIDYVRYNDIARSFVKTYDLNDASCLLNVTLRVNTDCLNESFSDECRSVYSTSLNIPLAKDTFSIYTTSSTAPNREGSFEYQGAVNRDLFLNISVIAASAAFVLAVLLLLFLHFTKNEDITYAARVRKILNSYSSFVQRIEGDFAFDEYQIIMVKTFNEMLGIRDTIQSPVLMLENRDETMTRFLIPTNTRLLYVFEIKVDNYDEIYSGLNNTPSDAVIDAPSLEYEAYSEPAEETEQICESEATPDPVYKELPPVEEIMEHLVEESGESGDSGADTLAYVDESGERVVIACKRSFTANLIQSNPQVKKYYNEIKNLILSYEGVKSRINWRLESFGKGRTNLFKLKIRGKTICLYCALNPDEFDKARYFHEKSDAKTFAQTPMLIRIKSDRGLRRAKTLSELVMQRFEIAKKSEASTVDFAGYYPYETTKHLVGRGLVKILLPGASAAEPMPHHHAHKDISEKPKRVSEQMKK